MLTPLRRWLAGLPLVGPAQRCGRRPGHTGKPARNRARGSNLGKLRYRSRFAVWRALHNSWRVYLADGTRTHPARGFYRCEHCPAWHLTSRHGAAWRLFAPRAPRLRSAL